MSAVLDLITGGDFLPHVYCKNIYLNTHESDDFGIKTKVTLNLQMYQNKNSLSESSWLSALNVDGANILDYLYIQLFCTTKGFKIDKLKKSYKPSEPEAGNVYLAHQNNELSGDRVMLPIGYRPGNPGGQIMQTRGLWGSQHFNVNFDDVVTDPLHNGAGADPNTVYNLFRPINVRLSSLLGDIVQAYQSTDDGQTVLSGEFEGKITEEIKNGIPYYVIPFEYSFFVDPGKSLAVGFYTFLHTISFLADVGISDDYSTDDDVQKYILQGPINTEIILQGGEPLQEREVFLTPDNKVWDGSVHMHITDVNPDENGYQGNGEASDIPTGWMAGKKHIPGADQPKLRLNIAPNTKIQDSRSPLVTKLPTLQGTGYFEPADNSSNSLYIPSLNQEVGGMAAELISPFQKKTKKYIDKFAQEGPGRAQLAARVSMYDSESEFSKLYLSRDRLGTARGLFFIDLKEFLINNSELFYLISNSVIAEEIIFNHSRILEMNLTRRRIKKQKYQIGNRNEAYVNDTLYEEAPQLVGRYADASGVIPKQQNFLYNLSIDTSFVMTGAGTMPADSATGPEQMYFVFNDFKMRKNIAGEYEYSLSVKYKDGTFEYLYNHLNNLARKKVLLDAYYDISMSGFNSNVSDPVVYRNSLNPDKEDGTMRKFRPYFENGSFNAQFAIDVLNTFGSDLFDELGLIYQLLDKHAKIFGLDIDFNQSSVQTWVSPIDGSPSGINIVQRLYDEAIKKLESVLGVTKLKGKSTSDLHHVAQDNGYSLKNIARYSVSSSRYIINEEYSFSDPTEIFHVVGNKDIYSDYLSITPADQNTRYVGLKTLSVEFYKDRCRLDALKFTPMAISNAGYTGIMADPEAPETYTPFNVAPVLDPGGDGVASKFAGSVHLIDRAYSYLTPSIIEMSDPSDRNMSYIHYYSCFSDTARAVFANPAASNTTFYSPFFSVQNAEKLFVNLINYNLIKYNFEDADLSDVIAVNPLEENVNAVELQKLDLRENYKNIFDKINITLHDADLHDDFFNKRSGATLSASYDSEPYFPYSINKYSDGNVLTQNVFRNFLRSGDLKGDINYPSANTGIDTSSNSQFNELPNSLKMQTVNIDRQVYFNQNVLQPVFEEAFGASNLNENISQTNLGKLVDHHSAEIRYNGIIFLNCNMTARIEVWRGPRKSLKLTPPYTAMKKPMKEDNDSWQLLEKSHLDNLAPNSSLFCRIRIYSEKLMQHIKIPINDQHFLITTNPADTADGPPVEEYSPDPPNFPKTNFRVFEAQAQELVQEIAETTEKGMSSEDPFADTGLGRFDKYKGDPDPTADPAGPDLGGEGPGGLPGMPDPPDVPPGFNPTDGVFGVGGDDKDGPGLGPTFEPGDTDPLIGGGGNPMDSTGVGTGASYQQTSGLGSQQGSMQQAAQTFNNPDPGGYGS